MTELHLTDEQLAVLTEGSMGENERGLLMEHLRACPSCFEAYQDALRYRGIWLSDATAFRAPDAVLAKAREIPKRHAAAEARESGRRRWLWPSWSPALGAVATAALVVAAFAVWRADFAPRQDRYSELVRPLQTAAERASRQGSIVIPGAETAESTTPLYRSGFVTADDAISQALRSLTRLYSDDSATPDLAHWLISGYLATGQLENARVYVQDARLRFPEDTRFLVLDALVAYRSSDMARAERLLQAVLTDDPHNGAAMINLGLVQYELGNWESARRTLELVRTRFAGSALEARAATLLSGLLNG